MEMQCTNCGKNYNASKQWQKYCSNACRVSAHNKRTHATETQQNNETITQQINAMETQPNNELETQSKKALDAMLERILSEREAVFQSKITAMEKDYQNKILELRLLDLEKKVNDLEKAQEENSGGIKMTDVMAGVGSYFATQMSSKTETPK
jgi:hypothetical protein